MPEMVTFLHTSDLHLGLSFYGELPPEIAENRRKELFDAFLRMIDFIQTEHIQLFLITGDFLDGDFAVPSMLERINQAFREIQHARVFIVPGSADAAGDGSFYRTFEWAPNVHIFKSAEWQSISVPEWNVTVHGCGWIHQEVPPASLERLTAADDGQIHILMAYEVGVTPEDIVRCKAAYAALGYNHQYTLYEEAGQLLGAYPGTPEPLSFDEPGEHGVIVGTAGRGWARGAFAPMAVRRFHAVHVEVESGSTPDDLIDVVRTKTSEEERGTDFYRFIVTGSVPSGPEWGSKQLCDVLQPYFHHVQVENRTLPDYDIERLESSNGQGVVGAFIRAVRGRIKLMEDRLNMTSDNVQREELVRELRQLELALSYGLEALLERRVSVR